MKWWFIRWLNFVIVCCGYLISRVSGRVVHWGNPLAISIEPNNTCNLSCPECPSGTHELTRSRGFMQPDLFKTVIDQLIPHLSWLTLYFQGEPYLNSHFFDFIHYARSRSIFVVTSTNGHFLNDVTVQKTIDSGLNRLIVSLDGDDQESYGQYRTDGNFEKVVSGIRCLVTEKKRRNSKYPEIILQCLLLRSTENRMESIRALARSLEIDKLEFKTAQFNDYRHGNPLMPTNPKHSRYKISPSAQQHGNTLYSVKNPQPNSCFRMWSSCVVTWDGKVVPCCFDKDGTFVLGDLTKQSFKQIWRGKSYHDFRNTILHNRHSIEICQNCTQTF